MVTPAIQTPTLSRSRAEKLGKLWARGLASANEVAEIRTFINSHIEPMSAVRSRLAERGLNPTARLKTETTILQKLTRSTALGNVQDLAGVRAVVAMTLDQQDQMVAGIKEMWPGAKVVDRRADPSSGYRGVHVVVEQDGAKVEIQVRTELQHEWAQAMERIADGWGRQIRYGGEPEEPERLVGNKTRSELVRSVIDLAPHVDAYEHALNDATNSGIDQNGTLETMSRDLMKAFSAAHSALADIHNESLVRGFNGPQDQSIGMVG